MFSSSLSISAFSTSLLIFAFLVIAYATIHAIYNLFLSPLSDIPGPWYAAISDFWLTTHTLRLRQCQYIHSLFEQYGPIVRVAPNKVMFNDLSSSRSVYSVHRFDKSVFYKSLVTNDNDHAMTTLDHASHAMRRKGYAPHYAPANLIQFQAEMQEPTIDLITALDAVGGNSSMECLSLFRQLMLDVIVTTSYGYRLGAVRKYTSQFEDPLAVAVNDFPKRSLLKNAVPAWTWKLIRQIPHARWQEFCNSDEIIAKFVGDRVKALRVLNQEGKLDECDKVPMLHRLLKHSYSKDTPMPDRDVISEAMGHMIAGIDTTSTSLSYFLWELSRRPEIASRLQDELDEVMHDPKAIPDMSILHNLPYLNAFIKEGLRVYSAAPSPLERVVPTHVSKSGMMMENYDLMGYNLPPGTIIATQAWSMHRNASVFPSPEVFMPERWLGAEGEELARMSAHMMPFGTGPRICGGQNVANMMMRMALASVLRNFDIVAAPETDENSMAMCDSFVIFPWAMECKLFFKPRV